MKRILSLLGVILLASAASAGLPGGGYPVEYLETDGNSWIDTGWVPDVAATNVASFTCAAMNVPAIYYGHILCGYKPPFKAGVGTYYYYYFFSRGKTLWYNSTSAACLTNMLDIGAFPTNEIMTCVTTLSLQKVSLSIGTNYFEKYADVTQSAWDVRAYIFANNITNTTVTSKSSKGFRLYDLKVASNGTNVFDYIPAIVSNTPALYDKLSGRYFYNSGTGTFGTGKRQPYGAVRTAFNPLGTLTFDPRPHRRTN